MTKRTDLARAIHSEHLGDKSLAAARLALMSDESAVASPLAGYDAAPFREAEAIGIAMQQLLDRVQLDCPHRSALAVIASRYQELRRFFTAKIQERPADDIFGDTSLGPQMQSENGQKFVGHVFVQFAEVHSDKESTFRITSSGENVLDEAQTVLEQVINTVGSSHLVVEKNGSIRHIAGCFGIQDTKRVAEMLATKTGGAVRMFVVPVVSEQPQTPSVKLA